MADPMYQREIAEDLRRQIEECDLQPGGPKPRTQTRAPRDVETRRGTPSATPSSG